MMEYLFYPALALYIYFDARRDSTNLGAPIGN